MQDFDLESLPVGGDHSQKGVLTFSVKSKHCSPLCVLCDLCGKKYNHRDHRAHREERTRNFLTD